MHLFVYGTLQAACDNPMAELLRANARLVGIGNVPGQLFDLGDYPGATTEPGCSTRVCGEVYWLHNPNIISQLDEYEDVSTADNEQAQEAEYTRRLVWVGVTDAAGNPTVYRCQMYAYALPTVYLTPISGGVWVLGKTR